MRISAMSATISAAGTAGSSASAAASSASHTAGSPATASPQASPIRMVACTTGSASAVSAVSAARYARSEPSGWHTTVRNCRPRRHQAADRSASGSRPSARSQADSISVRRPSQAQISACSNQSAPSPGVACNARVRKPVASVSAPTERAYRAAAAHSRTARSSRPARLR
jgi:hypothetical protein